MYTLIIENKDGLQLEFNKIGAAYNITNAQGLSPSKNTINTNTAALIDGGTFNSAKVNMRSINIAFTIEYPVEANRLNVYRVLRAKEPITLYYKSNLLDVFIEGYVETLDIGHFDMKQKATVSILCPFPYWKNAQQVVNELSTITNMFHFPFPYGTPVGSDVAKVVFGAIDTEAKAVVANNGGIETGLTFELYAKAPVSNPKIFDYITQDYIGLNFSMETGDLIIINTMIGQKSVTLIRNAVETNIFNSLQRGSTWLQLAAGGSVFVYQVDTGSLQSLEVEIKHFDLYEGV